MTIVEESSIEPPAEWNSASGAAATVLLIALIPILCTLGSFFGFVSIYASASLCDGYCGVQTDVAIVVMLFAPWVIWLASSVWAIVRLIRKQRATSIMVRGLLLSIVLYAAAFTVANVLSGMLNGR